MSCDTRPIMIGHQMSFGNWLALFASSQGVPSDALDQFIETNKNVAYFQALYTQAILESGHFNSNIYKQTSNMYGMKAPNSRHKYCDIVHFSDGGFAAYSTIGNGIVDRIGWDNQKSDFHLPVSSEEVPAYFAWIKSHGYATDDAYTGKLIHLYATLRNQGVFASAKFEYTVDNNIENVEQDANDYGNEQGEYSPSTAKSGTFSTLLIVFGGLAWLYFKFVKKSV